MATDVDTSAQQATPAAEKAAAPLKGRFEAVSHWAQAHRGLAIVALAGTVSVVGALTAYGVRSLVTESKPPPSYDVAVAALEAGAYAKAIDEAEALLAEEFVDYAEPGGPYYVAGAALFKQTDMSWSSSKRDQFLLAAEYLEDASKRGLQPESEGDCLFLLGKAKLFVGEPTEARLALQKALPLVPEDRAEIHWYLAQTYLYQPHPQFDKALVENTLYLEDKTLSPRRRSNGELQRAEILLHMDKVDAARQTLAEVSSSDTDSAKQSLLRGQFFMREGDRLKRLAIEAKKAARREALAESSIAASPPGVETPSSTAPEEDETSASEQGLQALTAYERAIKSFIEAARLDGQQTRVSRTAQLLAGRCLQEMGDFDQAIDQYAEVAELFPGSPEAVAALFLSAEIRRKLGQWPAAIDAYRRALGGLEDRDAYVNSWLTLDDMRNRLVDAYTAYMNSEQYEAALQLLDAVAPLFSPVEIAKWKAETESNWARWLALQGDAASPIAAEDFEQRARDHYRRAGEAYKELAGYEYMTRAYPDDLWLSAECFRLGHDFNAAAEMLKWYLTHEVRRRQPRALLNLGEALVHLARYDAALTVLDECIDFYPTDPVAYQARLLAARAHLEKGNTAHAERLLLDNLNGPAADDEPSGYLAPSSVEWRESLFALGQLQRREQQYDEAIKSLVKYVHYAERFDDRGPRLAEARYLLGQCHRDLVRKRREQFGESSAPSVQSSRALEESRLLEQALLQFRAARDDLKRLQEAHADLPAHETAMLRNCYLLIAGTLIDLGKYEEAIRECQAAVGRYQNSSEALTMYLEIARAYRLLDKPEMARAAIHSAETLLKLLREGGGFQGTSDYSAEEWDELLKWQSEL